MRSLLHKLSQVAMRDLATALDADRLRPPYSALNVTPYVPAALADVIAAEFNRMAAGGMQPTHIAECLRLLESEREAGKQIVDRVQLVWTGPEVPGSLSRDTGVVVRELFTSARRCVLVSSFTVRRGSEILAPLAAAMDKQPDLQVTIAINVSRDGDFNSSDHQIVARFAEDFWRVHWPWGRRPAVFYDHRGISVDPAVCASLHAKCIVIDGEVAFVTSANFTEWAQERNLEAGVLVRDQTFASALRNQFDSLISAKVLRLIPGSSAPKGFS